MVVVTKTPHQIEPQLQCLVHHLLGLAVILVLVLPPVRYNLEDGNAAIASVSMRWQIWPTVSTRAESSLAMHTLTFV